MKVNDYQMIKLLTKIREKQAKIIKYDTTELPFERCALEVLDIGYNDIIYKEDVFSKLKDALANSNL